MRVLISADMEGATGVTWTDDCVAGTEPWQRMRRLFTGDVNACVAGLVAGGATDVLVNESHSAQRNLLLEDLDDRARMLTGRHKPLSMMQGIDDGPDAVVFLGYHAMAGAQGVLAHTWLENAITQVRLDGEPVGEGGLNAAVAAEHGVPVVLVTGDDRACAEAATYAPDAVTVSVKECVSRYAAICLPPARSATLLRAGAEAAMAKAGRHAPQPGPHRVEIDFDAAHLADAAAVVPTVTQPGPCTVAVDARSMTAAYRAFKIMATVAASAMQAVYG
ncbi:M55 family metallopeptidase [Pseudonocardia sp. CA-107938]|uniref:M55 family metallopeptidase n=1 Tax=Pseudonocardia sp. CA-107938 TaxID=3240021 RepID=UPI003D94FCEE